MAQAHTLHYYVHMHVHVREHQRIYRKRMATHSGSPFICARGTYIPGVNACCYKSSVSAFLVIPFYPVQPEHDAEVQDLVLQADKLTKFKDEIRLLEKIFNHLVDEVKNDLNVHKVDLAKVKDSISKPLLFDTHTDAQPCLVDEHFNDIAKADSIDSLFLLLSYRKIWTVLSPALLQRIVYECGSSSIKDELERFMKELTRLRKKTRLKEFAQVFGKVADGCILAIKMGEEWEEKTLEDVENLKRQMEARSVYTQIIGATISCIILLWRIPFPRSHNALIRQIPHSFYEENDIKKVTLDGVTLFDSEVYKLAKMLESYILHIIATTHCLTQPQNAQEIPVAVYSYERVSNHAFYLSLSVTFNRVVLQVCLHFFLSLYLFQCPPQDQDDVEHVSVQINSQVMDQFTSVCIYSMITLLQNLPEAEEVPPITEEASVVRLCL